MWKPRVYRRPSAPVRRPPFAAAIAPTGAEFVAYPPAMSMDDMSAVLMNGDLMATFKLFVRVSSPLYDFFFRQLRNHRPGVLVTDLTAPGGGMVAPRLGTPRAETHP